MELFGDTFLPPELADLWVRARGCPICAGEIHAVASLGSPRHWLCTGCGRCWAPEHGHVRSVDPLTCQGCATRTKAACITRFGTRFPAFTGGGLLDDAS